MTTTLHRPDRPSGSRDHAAGSRPVTRSPARPAGSPGTRAAVELIAGQPQTLWGRLAVTNFTLGGLGAGYYAVSAAASLAGVGAPVHAHAAWLAPALVLAGFAAVGAEAGRPLRGVRVLARVRSSWMSRELWLGGGFAALALLDLAAPSLATRLLATLLAIGLAAAQGCILREARGVTAWNVAVMPVLFVTSATTSGVGLWLLIEAAGGAPGLRAGLGGAFCLLTVGLAVWLAYLTWSADEAFVSATAPLRAGPLASGLVVVSHVAPLALAALVLALPATAPGAGALMGAPGAGALAGALAIAGQVRLKDALVRRVGRLRPITLPTLTLRRQRP